MRKKGGKKTKLFNKVNLEMLLFNLQYVIIIILVKDLKKSSSAKYKDKKQS